MAETLGNLGGRTANQGYGKVDQIRKQYTGYEYDDESKLDYAQARYYNSSHGRFTSIDPLTASANVKDPQTFNRYTYAMNSPYKFTDPLGLISQSTGGNGDEWWRKVCNLQCRAKSGLGLSKQDTVLLQWHVANGTALGYTYQNVMSRRQQTTSQAPSAPTVNLPGTIKITRVSFLDEEGNVIGSKKDCQATNETGSQCISNEESFANVWELDVKTDTGPDTIKEFFKIKVEFEVVDSKGFESFDEKVSNVSVPKSANWQLESVAGQDPVKFDFQGTKGSVTMTLRYSKDNDETKGLSISVNLRANYSYTDLYKPETGYQKSAPRKESLRIRLYYGNRDGKVRK